MPEQFKDDAASGAHEGQSVQPLFTRPMPGGGSVRVELLVSNPADVAGERLRGRVVMDHQAPSDATVIVEELEGDDAEAVVPELLRIARDNAAIARRMMRKNQPTADGRP